MENFELNLRTRIVFGAGELDRLGQEARAIGRRILLVTGRGFARNCGLLDRALDLLEGAGCGVVVFDRMEPNPHTETVDEGARLAREEDCDLVVALGGGSVMDGAKGIAGVAVGQVEFSAWDYCRGGPRFAQAAPVRRALPLMAVPTLAATGSEVNGTAVLTNWATREKSVMAGPAIIPRLAIVDPALTLQAGPALTADGAVDIFAHLLEGYLTGVAGAGVQDRLTEGLMLATVENGVRAVRDGSDMEARANLSWASTLALSGIPSLGRGGAFPLHSLEHPLSGHFDVSHGRGLAAIMPTYGRIFHQGRPDRFALLGRRVFGVGVAEDLPAARLGVEALTLWLAAMGEPPDLATLGVDRAAFPKLAEEAIRLGGRGTDHLAGIIPMNREKVLEFYQEAYGPPN